MEMQKSSNKRHSIIQQCLIIIVCVCVCMCVCVCVCGVLCFIVLCCVVQLCCEVVWCDRDTCTPLSIELFNTGAHQH